MRAISAATLARMFEDLCPPPPARSPVRPDAAMWRNPTEAANDNLSNLADALNYISPDVGRGSGSIIGPDRQPVDDYWFGVMLAARRDLGPGAEGLLRAWSQGSPRYDEADFSKDWAVYEPEHPNPVTLASVFALARAKGWPGPQKAAPSLLASTSRYGLLDRAAIMAIPDLQWRVKGLFPKTGMGVVFGQSGSGKSFLVLDLANSIGKGERWFGRRTAACPVTYVSLEGEAGLKNRISALEKYSGAEISPNFRAIIQPFSFGRPQDVVDLAAVLPMDGVIFIDTLNRASAGLDENSGKDMSQILEAGKQLQELTNSLVLIVHHTGKDAKKGMRGHSSLHAALDGAIEVERSGNRRLWRAAKVKDGLDGEAVLFKLELVPLGRDGDGELFASCAIGPDTISAPPRKEPTGGSQKVALKALRQGTSRSPHLGVAGSDTNTPCIAIADAVAAIMEALPAVSSNRRTNNARNLIAKLTAGEFVETGSEGVEDWLWCLDG